MTTSERYVDEQAPPVPQPAWALAVLSLGQQVVRIFVEGRGSNSLVPSMLLGAVVVGWVSYGVLTARTVRTWLVLIVLVLGIVAESVTFLEGPTFYKTFGVTIAVLQLICLSKFSQTSYVAWQRARPPNAGGGLGGLVVIAILVGAIGGYVGAADDGFNVRINF